MFTPLSCRVGIMRYRAATRRAVNDIILISALESAVCARCLQCTTCNAPPGIILFAAKQKDWGWFTCRKPPPTAAYTALSQTGKGKGKGKGKGTKGTYEPLNTDEPEQPNITLRNGLVCSKQTDLRL